ncbi:MAG: hypothetical protein ABIQ98_02025 [Sphingomicrobium sp.]
MSVLKSLRMAFAGALVVAMPLQAVAASVRPGSAVPAAASTLAAQDERDRVGMGWAWPAIGVIVAAIILAILIERHNGNGRGAGFSR